MMNGTIKRRVNVKALGTDHKVSPVAHLPVVVDGTALRVDVVLRVVSSRGRGTVEEGETDTIVAPA